jgi:uncharacterized cupin superfamily protein
MVREAKLIENAGGGQVPAESGWFVLNAADATWLTGDFGSYTRFEGDADGARFVSLGINIGILEPGQASSYYHAENAQEDFLVLSGECLLIVEGQERMLRQWDLVHCPVWTEHVFVGAGQGRCVMLAVGARPSDEIIYPVSELAQRHRAGVTVEARDGDQAYAAVPPDVPVPFSPGWLPAGNS